MLISARRRPRVVNTVDYHPGFAFGDQLPRHRRAHEIHAGLEDRRDVRLPRINVRGQEKSRSGIALLMNVVDDLWMPNVVDFIDRKLRFDLSERIPIAVVIVTRVVVIKLRRVSAFGWSAERLVVPGFDYVVAIGIE